MDKLTLSEAVRRATADLDATVEATGLKESAKRTDSGVHGCANAFEPKDYKTRNVTTSVVLGTTPAIDVLLTVARFWRAKGFRLHTTDEEIRKRPDFGVSAEAYDEQVNWYATTGGPGIDLRFDTVCLPDPDSSP